MRMRQTGRGRGGPGCEMSERPQVKGGLQACARQAAGWSRFHAAMWPPWQTEC